MTDDDATPVPTPTVRAILADARRVLAEDVTGGPWQAGLDIPEVANNDPDPRLIWSGSLQVASCKTPWISRPKSSANARVMAAARRLLEHAIDAVEDCEYCGGADGDGPCGNCRERLDTILAATGRGGGDETKGA